MTFDRITENNSFQHCVLNQNEIENPNMIDGNSENLYAKVAPFIKKNIFEKITDDHLSCYSTYKCYNLIFYGESTKMRKNITKSS